MYRRQPNWLPLGPPNTGARPVALPLLLIERKPRRGVGAWLDASYCSSWYSLLDPVAYVACLPEDAVVLADKAGTYAANQYNTLQYGRTPLPSELPGPPAPSAPANWVEGTADFVETQSAMTEAQRQAWVRAQQAYLQSQQNSGAWNPKGNLPLNALDFSKFWEQYKTPLLIGGAVLGGLVLFKAVKR